MHESLSDKDTIVAVATPYGKGAVGVIRLSGSLVPLITKSILGVLPVPRQATVSLFKAKSGDVLDQGVAIYFPEPRSFTGESVLELQGHGSPVVMDSLLAYLKSLGARIARPGEFSERAFLNNKMSLMQAEAIADIIESSSHQAALSAVRSLQGTFYRTVKSLSDSLTSLRVYVESSIDFSEEPIEELYENQIIDRLESLLDTLSSLLGNTKQGVLLRDGIHLAIVGPPNAGKSSLLNRFLEDDIAIVTSKPGTTRDTLRGSIQLDGLPLHIVDTAGLRESWDEIEQEGIRRSWEQLNQVNCVLLLIDDRDSECKSTQELLLKVKSKLASGSRLITVYNKIDITQKQSQTDKSNSDEPRVWISVKTGEGWSLLLDLIKDQIGYMGYQEGSFIARQRHLDALRQSFYYLEVGYKQFKKRRIKELLAEDLRQSAQALFELTGEFSSDDLLGKIFSEFCIGK